MLRNHMERILDNIKIVRSSLVVISTLVLMTIIGGYYYGNHNLVLQVLYSIIFMFAFLIPGYSILNIKYFDKFNTRERLVLAFGLSFLVYAILMLTSGSVFSGGTLHLVNLIMFVAINIAGLFVIYRKGNVNEGDNVEKRDISWILVAFLSFIIFFQIYVALPFAMPDKLQDGPYVFKERNNLHIKIQAMTGDLPADNFVPYVFSQFLLQEISFEKNRPMLPGQEVSNRTVLMGLNAAYFLSVFRMPLMPASDKLGVFRYVGSDWPDVGKLGDDNTAFSIFLTMAMIMNAVFLLAILLLIGSLFGRRKGLGIMLILMVFPYTINQVIFTWPKCLMAYCLIVAVHLVIKRSNPYLIGLFLALAYNSHPAAMVYVGFIILYWLAKNFSIRNKQDYVNFAKIVVVLIAGVLPWIIWTKVIVKIPSDLITQNLVANDYGLLSMIKVRLDNLYSLFTLAKFQANSPARTMFLQMTFTFAGAIGIYFVLAYYCALRYLRQYYKEILLLFLGPVVLLIVPWGRITGSFSVLFAQPAIPVFFAFAVVLFLKYRKTSIILLVVQALISLYALWFGMYNLYEQTIYSDMPTLLFVLAILMQISFIYFGILNLLRDVGKER